MKAKGFTLVELVIAIGLAAIFIPAIVYVYSFSLGSASTGEKYNTAYALAQEQMEAIYYLKENDAGWTWDTSPENTLSGEFYQPKNTGTGWILGSKTTAPVTVDGYKSTVEILPVNRDGEEISESGGTVDLNTRKIIVSVYWEENGVPSDIDLVSYVTNH